MNQKPLCNTKPKTKARKVSKNPVSAFIAKTYEILEECKYPDIVDWNFEGNAIVIKKPQEFAQTVLNIYFKHKNLTSFVRQLNMYNFHKQRTPKIEHVYFHELFQRDKKYLLSEIKRKNQEQSLSDSQEPAEETDSVDANQDISTIIQEKQVLKRFNNQAVGKISCLEGKIKDLTVQNQTLKNQIWQQDERDKILISLMANILKKYGIPPTELSSMIKSDLKSHTFQLESETNSMSPQASNIAEKSTGTSDETDIFLNLEDYNTEPIIPQTVLNNKINFVEEGQFGHDISPSSYIGKGEKELHWGPYMPQPYVPYIPKTDKDNFCVPKSYKPQFHQVVEKDVNYNNFTQGPRMRLQAYGDTNLGKRMFDERKQGDYMERDSFEVIMKKFEAASSLKKENQNCWNPDMVDHMWIKNKECCQDFNVAFKPAY